MFPKRNEINHLFVCLLLDSCDILYTISYNTKEEKKEKKFKSNFVVFGTSPYLSPSISPCKFRPDTWWTVETLMSAYSTEVV